MKRKMSGPSSWAGMHPQPDALLRPASPPSPGEATSPRQERKPHRYPGTGLSRAQRQHRLQLCGPAPGWKGLLTDYRARHRLTARPAKELPLAHLHSKGEAGIPASAAPSPNLG